MVDDEFDNDEPFEGFDEAAADRAGLPDSIRRALVSGLSAVLTTEEGIRNALGDMRMPKEALAYLAQQTDRTRRELFGAVGEEVRGFLKGVDLTGELRKALTGLKVQVKAEITFTDEGLSVDTARAAVEDADASPAAGKKKRRRRKAASDKAPATDD